MTQHRSSAFPFSADMDAPGGLDPMALALILTSISPEVGGVLVRGEKGTAKSTIVRALAAVLPPTVPRSTTSPGWVARWTTTTGQSAP